MLYILAGLILLSIPFFIMNFLHKKSKESFIESLGDPIKVTIKVIVDDVEVTNG